MRIHGYNGSPSADQWSLRKAPRKCTASSKQYIFFKSRKCGHFVTIDVNVKRTVVSKWTWFLVTFSHSLSLTVSRKFKSSPLTSTWVYILVSLLCLWIRFLFLLSHSLSAFFCEIRWALIQTVGHQREQKRRIKNSHHLKTVSFHIF